jgi:hypothetical protein
MKTVKILHPQFGVLQDEVYIDDTQFKLYLKLVHSCIELKEDLTTFNGKDFFLHIPYKLLKDCMIMGNVRDVSLAEYAIQKSKMETIDD